MRQTSCAFTRLLPRLLFVLASLAPLTGCIHDVIHGPVAGPPPTPATVDYATRFLKLSPKPTSEQRLADNNHATVEFSESGELLDPCPTARGDKTLCQLENARYFIQSTRTKAAEEEDGPKSLIVIAFMHGNLNNASEESDNYPHFRQLINCLNLGSVEYERRYKAEPGYKKGIVCENVNPPKAVRYTGIYLGWRGVTNKVKANVREGAAQKITHGTAVRKALFALRNAAKDATTPSPARFVVVGHSFGGLIVEQSMIDIYEDAYRNPQEMLGPCPKESTPVQGLRPFTDMVFTINEAVNSVPAKKFIEFLKPLDQYFCNSPRISPALHRPLLMAVESKTDFWSVGSGTYLRHWFGKDRGKPGDLVDTTQYPEGRYVERLTKLNTPPNDAFFQNLCYLPTGDYSTGENLCEEQRKANQYPGALGRAVTMPFSPVLTDTPVAHLYVRYACKPIGNTESGKESWPDCTSTSPQNDRNQLHVWNNTPYWIGAIDFTVANGHSDFWNEKFIALLSGVTNAFDTLTLDEVIPGEPVVHR